MFDSLARCDLSVSLFVQRLRVRALTPLFVVASAWWVKGVLIAGIGGVDELRRRRFPRSFVCASAAAAVAWPVIEMLKRLVGRARPSVVEPSIEVVGDLPDDSSFPSGDAMAAFAAATAVATLRPRLRVPALGAATLVAASRVYLGAHFLTDVVAGAAVGSGIGCLIARACNAGARRRALTG